jgi:hypothetical protein
VEVATYYFFENSANANRKRRAAIPGKKKLTAEAPRTPRRNSMKEEKKYEADRRLIRDRHKCVFGISSGSPPPNLNSSPFVSAFYISSRYFPTLRTRRLGG